MKQRISQILAGKVAVGSKVTVEGWIRTRRDSKAGLSFLAVHDGSLLRRAPGRRAGRARRTTQTEVLQLTTGCAVRATGELVASQGKGQAVEIRADAVEVVGWVDDPDTYPMQPKRHTHGVPARGRPPARRAPTSSARSTRVRHTLAQAVHRFFHEHGFFWIHTPIITASDAEGAGQMFRVSTLDAANPPRTPDGKVDWDKDFFGKEAHLTVSGQLNVETYCLAMTQGLHVRPDVPRRELATRAATSPSSG